MHNWQNLWDYKLWVSWFRGRFFLANDSKASIGKRSMDGRIYVGDHKTYIYKLWVSPFQKKRFLSFFPLYVYTYASQPKNHMQQFPFHTWRCFICNLTKLVRWYTSSKTWTEDAATDVGPLVLKPHVSFRGHVS